MGTEIETKFRLADPVSLRAALHQLRGRYVGRVFESNWLFDTPDRRLRAAGCGLRIRTAQPVADEGNTAATAVSVAPALTTLTFKGPRHLIPFPGETPSPSPGGLKSREEIETTVAGADALILILDRLGFVPVLGYQKRRETWRLGGCEIVLDELPRLGWFLEIEAPDPAAIQTVRTQLGLAGVSPVAETYPELTAAHGVTDSAGRRSLFFP